MKSYKKEKYWKYVEEFIKELKTADYWFKNDGKPNPEWKLFETRDAACGSVLDAAGDADMDALMKFTLDTDRNAACGAVRNTAINSNRYDAIDDAWDVAWDASRKVNLDIALDACIFSIMLVCLDLEVEIKHLVHLNSRMEVWRKGYGLFCDIDGVLYVYKRL